MREKIKLTLLKIIIGTLKPIIIRNFVTNSNIKIKIFINIRNIRILILMT